MDASQTFKHEWLEQIRNYICGEDRKMAFVIWKKFP